MNFSLHFSYEAKQDVSATYKWYENVQKGLGSRFRTDLKQTASFLRSEPDALQVKYADIRIIFLRKFPYEIHYRIRQKKVRVLAVLHVKRKPRFGD